MLSNGAGLKVPGGKCGYLKEYERENAGKKNTHQFLKYGKCPLS